MLRGAILALLASSPGIDLEDMLRRPVSAASLAALVEFREDPRVSARWIAGLSDSRPEVRAAAARAIHVAGLSSLANPIFAVLANETDPTAAREEIRALANLGTAEQLLALPAAARRAGGMVEHEASLALARRLGLRALAEIPGFWELHAYDSADVARMTTRRQPEAVAALPGLALAQGDANLFAAALKLCRELGLAESSTIVPALQSDSPQIRAQVFWHLTFIPPGQLSAEWMAAVALTPEARGQAPDPEAAFVHELLRRRQGEPKRDNAASLTTIYREERPRHPLDGSENGQHLTSLLLEPEVKAIVEGLLGGAPAPPNPVDYLEGVGTMSRFRASTGQPDLMRTPDRFSALLARESMSLLGCKASQPPDMFGAQMTFGPDGRPRRTGLTVPEGSNASCAAAARVVFVNLLAPPEHSDFATSQSVAFVLPFEPLYLACPAIKPSSEHPSAGQGGAASPRLTRVGGRIKEPRKLRDVKPAYPRSLVNARVQGLVIAEATISPEGCIADLRVLRSPHPALAWEALRAISGWRYTPTLLNGIPVPVIMTVTVNFRLT